MFFSTEVVYKNKSDIHYIYLSAEQVNYVKQQWRNGTEEFFIDHSGGFILVSRGDVLSIKISNKSNAS